MNGSLLTAISCSRLAWRASLFFSRKTSCVGRDKMQTWNTNLKEQVGEQIFHETRRYNNKVSDNHWLDRRILCEIPSRDYTWVPNMAGLSSQIWLMHIRPTFWIDAQADTKLWKFVGLDCCLHHVQLITFPLSFACNYPTVNSQSGSRQHRQSVWWWSLQSPAGCGDSWAWTSAVRRVGSDPCVGDGQPPWSECERLWAAYTPHPGGLWYHSYEAPWDLTVRDKQQTNESIVHTMIQCHLIDKHNINKFYAVKSSLTNTILIVNIFDFGEPETFFLVELLFLNIHISHQMNVISWSAHVSVVLAVAAAAVHNSQMYLFEYSQVEKLLEFLVAVVDAKLLKAVCLKVLWKKNMKISDYQWTIMVIWVNQSCRRKYLPNPAMSSTPM